MYKTQIEVLIFFCEYKTDDILVSTNHIYYYIYINIYFRSWSCNATAAIKIITHNDAEPFTRSKLIVV